MEIDDITREIICQEIESHFSIWENTYARWHDVICGPSPRNCFFPTPIFIGDQKYHCSLEADVVELLKHVKGEIKSAYAQDLCQKIVELFWIPSYADASYTVDWKVWRQSAIGSIVHEALYNNGDSDNQ